MVGWRTKIGLASLLVAVIVTGVSFTQRANPSQKFVIGRVVIDSDNVLLTPNTQMVLDGLAERALIVSNIPTAMVLNFAKGGPGSWGSRIVSSSGSAPTGTLINTETGNRVRQLTVGKGVQLLAADGHAEHFVTVDARRGVESATLIDAADGASHTVPFTAMSVTPVIVASSLDERRGRLVAATLLSPTMDGLAQDRGIALFDTRSGRLLHLATLPPEPALRHPGWPTAPSLNCSVAINESVGRAFIFSTGGSVAVFDTVTGQLIDTHRLPAALRAAQIDERSGRIFAISNNGAPLCHGIFLEDLATPASKYVVMLDAHTGKALRTISLPIIPTDLGVDAAMNRVIVTGDLDSRVAFIDARTGRLIKLVAVNTTNASVPSRLVAVDRRRHRLIIASTGVMTDGPHTTLSVLDIRKATVLRTISVDGFAESIAIDERSGHIVILAISSGQPPSDFWGWLPSGLRRSMPLIPAPPAIARPSRLESSRREQVAVVLTIDLTR